MPSKPLHTIAHHSTAHITTPPHSYAQHTTQQHNTAYHSTAHSLSPYLCLSVTGTVSVSLPSITNSFKLSLSCIPLYLSLSNTLSPSHCSIFDCSTHGWTIHALGPAVICVLLRGLHQESKFKLNTSSGQNVKRFHSSYEHSIPLIQRDNPVGLEIIQRGNPVGLEIIQRDNPVGLEIMLRDNPIGLGIILRDNPVG